MEDFYTRFYQAVASSAANAAYCEAVYGKNLCQQGFADVVHLDEIMRLTGMDASHHVLDLGCGNGMIAEYFSDHSGAHVTGIDFIPGAVEQALARTEAKRSRLDFAVMDIGKLQFPADRFDIVVSIDTLYFSDLRTTLLGILDVIKPGGTFCTVYDLSAMPDDNLDTYDRRLNLPEANDLGLLLEELGLQWSSRNLNTEVLAHVRRRLAVLPTLKEQYEAESNLFLYKSHSDEAYGMQRAFSNDAGGRHLYCIRKRFSPK